RKSASPVSGAAGAGCERLAVKRGSCFCTRFSGSAFFGATGFASAADFVSASAVFGVASGPAAACSDGPSGAPADGATGGTPADGATVCDELASGAEAASWVAGLEVGFSAGGSLALDAAVSGFRFL